MNLLQCEQKCGCLKEVDRNSWPLLVWTVRRPFLPLVGVSGADTHAGSSSVPAFTSSTFTSSTSVTAGSD